MAVNALRSSRHAPWSAAVAALIGEALHHQVLSDMLRFRCELGGPLPGLALALLVWMLMAAGAWMSWASVRGPDRDPHDRTRRFIAAIGGMMCALFSVAVLWQTLATWILPPCP